MNLKWVVKIDTVVFWVVKGINIKKCYSILFYYPKNYFINYIISFYNIFSISNFYFPILLIKIIYLHNKIIFPQSL